MRVGLQAVLVSGKICIALLWVMAIALVNPGSDLAFSQSGTGSLAGTPSFIAIDLKPRGVFAASGISGDQLVGVGFAPVSGDPYIPHALLWNGTGASVVDLHPLGFANGSYALAISGRQQVGWGRTDSQAPHALLWSGSAASAVDLNPSGFEFSQGLGISSGQQVGIGWGPSPSHALLWSGSAASSVDLHPSEFTDSRANGVSDGQQVGYAGGKTTDGKDFTHALLWRGTAASVVDLHPSGFWSSEVLGISGGQQVGDGIIAYTGVHALLWRGSAASVVDLNPSGFDDSEAHGTNGEDQVGFGYGQTTGGGNHHALLWRGTAASVVDLHAFLPSGFDESEAYGIDSNGNILGAARVQKTEERPEGDLHPFLWVPTKKPGSRQPVLKSPKQEIPGLPPSAEARSVTVAKIDALGAMATFAGGVNSAGRSFRLLRGRERPAAICLMCCPGRTHRSSNTPSDKSPRNLENALEHGEHG